jgi:polar amino acid transport system substrate-binding protein
VVFYTPIPDSFHKEAQSMKRSFVVLALLIVAGAMVFAGGKTETASAKKTYVVATDSTFPPMEFVDDQKQIVGFDMDLMKAIADVSGFAVTFKSVAWDGIFAGIAADKYDIIISSVTITAERKQEMDFSDPYFNAGQVLVVKGDAQNVTTLKDLAGKTVGSQLGTTGAMEVEKVKEVTSKTYDDIGLAFEDLVNGRIQGVVVDTFTARDYALQNAKYKGTLKVAGTPFTDESYGIVVKKGNKTLLDLINAGLKKVKDSGKYAEIAKKWIP